MTRSRQAVVPASRARGAQRIGDPRVWGTTIGAAGATVFVMANRAGLPGTWPTVAVIAWAVALIAYLWLVFGVQRVFPAAQAVPARAGLVYLGSVVGMLVLIRAGSAVLDGSGRGDLRPALIVVAVGAHFLLFATAFHTPMFMLLGAVMAGIGIAGLASGWVWDGYVAGAAVTAGVVMLLVDVVDRV